MEKLIESLKKNRILIFIAAVIICILHSAVCYYRKMELLEAACFILINIVMFFIVWGIANLNYAIQKHNDMIKIENVKRKNKFEMYTSLFLGVIAIAVDLIVPFFIDAKDVLPFCVSSFIFGSLFASLKIDDKDKDRYEEINASKDLRVKEMTGMLFCFMGAIFLILSIALTAVVFCKKNNTSNDNEILCAVFGGVGIIMLIAGIVLYKNREQNEWEKIK